MYEQNNGFFFNGYFKWAHTCNLTVENKTGNSCTIANNQTAIVINIDTIYTQSHFLNQ